MFRIKICGITTVEDAALAADAGADAVGLNFYPPSPRCVEVSRAAEITAALPDRVSPVGVFVNMPAGDIRRTCEAAGLSAVQLHGDEPWETLRELDGLRVIRAFRCHAANLTRVDEYLADCTAAGCLPEAIMIDAYRPGQFGGTGELSDWNLVRDRPGALAHLPLVLAGGLTAANVSEAISEARPDAVDTASGVESSPGRKSPELVRQFVARATDAFRKLV